MEVSARLGIQSGGASLVVSLEATNIWKLDDPPARGRLHGGLIWRVHLQGLMDSPPMVEIDVRTDNAAQVPLVKDNDVVQALSTERPDNPFGVRILPRTPRCGDHFFDIETAHTPTEPRAVDAVAITNPVSLHGRLRHGDAKLGQLADDTR